ARAGDDAAARPVELVGAGPACEGVPAVRHPRVRGTRPGARRGPVAGKLTGLVTELGDGGEPYAALRGGFRHAAVGGTAVDDGGQRHRPALRHLLPLGGGPLARFGAEAAGEP